MVKYTASVLGATGIAGGEILSILLKHPNIAIKHCFASSSAGTKLGEHHPQLVPLSDIVVEKFSIDAALDCDVIFISLPHGASHEYTTELEKRNYGGIIIDVGADHRLERAQDWQEFYADGGEFSAPYVYGLPELHLSGSHPSKSANLASQVVRQREHLRQAKRIAVAGCNVTAVTFGLQPLFALNAVKPENIVAVLANGYSGAGKSLKPHLLATTALENAKPYAVGGVHRHIPEIRQNLAKTANNTDLTPDDIKISFTPTLVPMNRGILATISVQLKSPLTTDELQSIYTDFYKNETFVNILPNGTHPQTAANSGQNYADISVTVDSQTGNAVIIIAIDNLVRGTAGTAIQCVNLALGLAETTALLPSSSQCHNDNSEEV